MTKGVEDQCVKTDFDALLTALHAIWATVSCLREINPHGAARLPTDAELVCVAVAQVLVRHDSERHWIRAAPSRIGHL